MNAPGDGDGKTPRILAAKPDGPAECCEACGSAVQKDESLCWECGTPTNRIAPASPPVPETTLPRGVRLRVTMLHAGTGRRFRIEAAQSLLDDTFTVRSGWDVNGLFPKREHALPACLQKGSLQAAQQRVDGIIAEKTAKGCAVETVVVPDDESTDLFAQAPGPA